MESRFIAADKWDVEEWTLQNDKTNIAHTHTRSLKRERNKEAKCISNDAYKNWK